MTTQTNPLPTPWALHEVADHECPSCRVMLRCIPPIKFGYTADQMRSYAETAVREALAAQPAPAGLTEAAVRAAIVATREYMLGFLSRHLPRSEVYEHLRRPCIEAAMCAAVMDCEGVRAALTQEGSTK